MEECRSALEALPHAQLSETLARLASAEAALLALKKDLEAETLVLRTSRKALRKEKQALEDQLRREECDGGFIYDVMRDFKRRAGRHFSDTSDPKSQPWFSKATNLANAIFRKVNPLAQTAEVSDAKDGGDSKEALSLLKENEDLNSKESSHHSACEAPSIYGRDSDFRSPEIVCQERLLSLQVRNALGLSANVPFTPLVSSRQTTNKDSPLLKPHSLDIFLQDSERTQGETGEVEEESAAGGNSKASCDSEVVVESEEKGRAKESETAVRFEMEGTLAKRQSGLKPLSAKSRQILASSALPSHAERTAEETTVQTARLTGVRRLSGEEDLTQYLPPLRSKIYNPQSPPYTDASEGLKSLWSLQPPNRMRAVSIAEEKQSLTFPTSTNEKCAEEQNVSVAAIESEEKGEIPSPPIQQPSSSQETICAIPETCTQECSGEESPSISEEETHKTPQTPTLNCWVERRPDGSLLLYWKLENASFSKEGKSDPPQVEVQCCVVGSKDGTSKMHHSAASPLILEGLEEGRQYHATLVARFRDAQIKRSATKGEKQNRLGSDRSPICGASIQLSLLKMRCEEVQIRPLKFLQPPAPALSSGLEEESSQDETKAMQEQTTNDLSVISNLDETPCRAKTQVTESAGQLSESKLTATSNTVHSNVLASSETEEKSLKSALVPPCSAAQTDEVARSQRLVETQAVALPFDGEADLQMTPGKGDSSLERKTVDGESELRLRRCASVLADVPLRPQAEEGCHRRDGCVVGRTGEGSVGSVSGGLSTEGAEGRVSDCFNQRDSQPTSKQRVASQEDLGSQRESCQLEFSDENQRRPSSQNSEGSRSLSCVANRDGLRVERRFVESIIARREEAIRAMFASFRRQRLGPSTPNFPVQRNSFGGAESGGSILGTSAKFPVSAASPGLRFSQHGMLRTLPCHLQDFQGARCKRGACSEYYSGNCFGDFGQRAFPLTGPSFSVPSPSPICQLQQRPFSEDAVSVQSQRVWAPAPPKPFVWRVQQAVPLDSSVKVLSEFQEESLPMSSSGQSVFTTSPKPTPRLPCVVGGVSCVSFNAGEFGGASSLSLHAGRGSAMHAWQMSSVELKRREASLSSSFRRGEEKAMTRHLPFRDDRGESMVSSSDLLLEGNKALQDVSGQCSSDNAFEKGACVATRREGRNPMKIEECSTPSQTGSANEPPEDGNSADSGTGNIKTRVWKGRRNSTTRPVGYLWTPAPQALPRIPRSASRKNSSSGISPEPPRLRGESAFNQCY